MTFSLYYFFFLHYKLIKKIINLFFCRHELIIKIILFEEEEGKHACVLYQEEFITYISGRVEIGQTGLQEPTI